tara:strand:+ start:269 stop:847 length:579 start_codon:yes stop_codon:yes gene_type:complete
MKFFYFLFFLLISCSLVSQNKWNVGVNLSAVAFRGQGSVKVKERVNIQFPSIQVSRKLGKNIFADFIYTVDILGFSQSANSFNYASFDAYLRYNLSEIFLNIVPFGGVGFGYIQGATSIPNSEGSLSLNIMGGGTLWVSKSFGLTGRLIYKHVSSDSESMAPHIQAIGGIVYRFDLNSFFSERRSHIWNMKH